MKQKIVKVGDIVILKNLIHAIPTDEFKLGFISEINNGRDYKTELEGTTATVVHVESSRILVQTRIKVDYKLVLIYIWLCYKEFEILKSKDQCDIIDKKITKEDLSVGDIVEVLDTAVGTAENYRGAFCIIKTIGDRIITANLIGDNEIIFPLCYNHSVYPIAEFKLIKQQKQTNMKTPQTITRKQLKELYESPIELVCKAWKSKIKEFLVTQDPFSDTFEVPESLIKEAYEAVLGNSVQITLFTKYFKKPFNRLDSSEVQIGQIFKADNDKFFKSYGLLLRTYDGFVSLLNPEYTFDKNVNEFGVVEPVGTQVVVTAK